jgi:hypothetical protein
MVLGRLHHRVRALSSQFTVLVWHDLFNFTSVVLVSDFDI